jgi:release factor glutamine methyltransferase
MKPITRRALLDSAVARLEEAGVEDARRNAEWLMEEALEVERVDLYAHPEAEVPQGPRDRFERMLGRRLTREPIQYVLGYADFFGLRFRVTPAVLIPRPETEEVVEEALRRIREIEQPWVLDVGSGSGAIAVAIHAHRRDAAVIAADVSEDALAIAAENARSHGLDVTFVHADALRPDFVNGVPNCFDLVVSNPPYVPDAERASMQPEVRDHEPPAALFAGDDPLRFYRAITAHAASVLKPGGHLVFETHTDYAHGVRAVLESAGFQDTEVRRDLAGHWRIAAGRWPGRVE